MRKHTQEAHQYQFLALVGGLFLAIQLLSGTDGLPPLPRAWIVLWQTVPHLTQAWQVHGITAGLAFTGLVALSLMQAALWIGCLILLWHIGKYVRIRSRHVVMSQRAMSFAPSEQRSAKYSMASGKHPALSVLEPVSTPLLAVLGNDMPLPVIPSTPTSDPSVPICVPSHDLLPIPQSLPLPVLEPVQVPVTLTAASRLAPSPWIACRVGVREGMMKMADEQGARTIPYIACFAVEGYGSHDTAGDAVCERVLDTASEALVTGLKPLGCDAVETALRASVAEANHMLVLDNEAHHGYLTASLAVCLLTTTHGWMIATGHTSIFQVQDEQTKRRSDVGNVVFLGEQECLEGDKWPLVVMQIDTGSVECILLGAGEGWSEAEPLLHKIDKIVAKLFSSVCFQHIVDVVAVASTGAAAGLLVMRERPLIIS